MTQNQLKKSFDNWQVSEEELEEDLAFLQDRGQVKVASVSR